jgi:predicted RNA-binding Zn ribbon-like protein
MITSNMQATGLKDNWLCIDFVNTLEWRKSDQPINHLDDYRFAIDWALVRGVISEEEGQSLRLHADDHPAEAEAACKSGVALREAIYRLLAVDMHNLPFNPGDLEILNGWLVRAGSHLCLARDQSAYTQQWDEDIKQTTGLERLFWPVALTAGELLMSEDLARLGQCADDRGCGWVFIDTSRNHTRRWCSMNDCGNRAKSRRHYARVKLQEN